VARGKDGTEYRGFYEDGKFHGLGKLKYPNGDVYEGSWKDG
jgi:hypothetical protein